jgi:hypothetical protein
MANYPTLSGEDDPPPPPYPAMNIPANSIISMELQPLPAAHIDAFAPRAESIIIHSPHQLYQVDVEAVRERNRTEKGICIIVWMGFLIIAIAVIAIWAVAIKIMHWFKRSV